MKLSYILSTVVVTTYLMFGVMGQAKSEDVKVSDELTIHYQQSGSGDTAIIFIPGWTMSTDVFVHQLEHFAESTQFRAITYDPRGQGLSTKTAEGHSYQQHGRDLAALIAKLELKSVILAGWSYGVLDAMAYIHQFGTDKLKALVLIDGTPKSSGNDNAIEWVWFRNDDADGYRQGFSMGAVVDRKAMNVEFAKWMLEDQSNVNINWVENMVNMTSNSVAALTNELGAYLDYSADLKALEGKMPLLYVVREEWEDIVLDWATANTPSAKVVAMGKHLMFWERHADFNAVLDHFLTRLE